MEPGSAKSGSDPPATAGADGAGVWPASGESGNASLYVLSGPSGQGHETVFPELVAHELGMEAENIVLRASDPGGPPWTKALH